MVKGASQTREAGGGEAYAEEINDKLDVSALSRNSPLAVTHYVGSRGLIWFCPRVRGLTRG